MSFEKVDLRAARDVDRENAKLAETLAEDLKFNANWVSEALSQAYAEIDRLTAENAKLAAELDELRDKQNEPARPRWTPPTALKDGEYRWNAANGEFRDASGNGWSTDGSLKLLKDWMRPPVAGRWRITAGKAEYLGP